MRSLTSQAPIIFDLYLLTFVLWVFKWKINETQKLLIFFVLFFRSSVETTKTSFTQSEVRRKRSTRFERSTKKSAKWKIFISDWCNCKVVEWCWSVTLILFSLLVLLTALHRLLKIAKWALIIILLQLINEEIVNGYWASR